MKFKVEDLKQMIKEELQVILTDDEAGEIFGIQVQRQLAEGHGGEGSMAVGQLSRMAEMVDEVRGMIDEQDDLEEWVESKITKAQDYLSSVLNYMSGKRKQRICGMTMGNKELLKQPQGQEKLDWLI